jgi:hypothetical protein
MLFTVAEAVALAMLCQGPDGGTPEPPVQRNPEVGEAQHDTSPPLRDIPPAPRKPGYRVHEVKPIPRPKPPPQDDGGTQTDPNQ